VNGIQSASVPLSGGALELQFVGGGRQLREQALPLLFRVKSQNAPVAVGQPVKVIVKTSRTTKGVAVPQASVARNSAGDTVVWVHIAPERFAQRRVNAQPLDASAVALSTGIVTGERVVTDGANLLAQVR
jgi:multidrug efflux pump subunit AcrA (membrane-fusion protein)